VTKPKGRAAVIWAADVDRVAHARTPKALRTLCGLHPVPDRFTWPALSRCDVCEAALEGLPIG
jgi:transposase